MRTLRTIVFAVCLLGMAVGLSGCSLLTLPFQLIGGAFDLLGKALAIADAAPKPPPWVFF